MSAKELRFSVDAREKMLRGIETLAHAVRATLGPPGNIREWMSHPKARRA